MTDLLIAPYQGFRPDHQFYAELFGGCFTGRLMDCNWSCTKCWSRFGGKGETPKLNLTPAQAADKFIRGLRRNAMLMGRITYGEPVMHWRHVEEVIAEFLQRTQGERMVVPGFTGRAGEAMGLIIETNGSLLKPKMLDALEQRHGPDAARIVINIGIKATTPEQLSQLTGHPPAVAERFHRTQLAAIFHMAFNCQHLEMYASFLDKFTDPEILAGIVREVERGRPGYGRRIDVLDYVNYQNTTRLYVPKHLRAVPGDTDEETINALSAPDGPHRRQELTCDQAVPATDPEGADVFGRKIVLPAPAVLRAALARDFAKDAEKTLRPGTMHPRRQR